MVRLGNDWDEVLAGEFDKPYYLALRSFLKAEYASCRIYPEMGDLFNALKYAPYADVKAVIVGQDPYHQPGQAHGLCFSVQKGVPPPPSLVNIFKELKSDLGIEPPPHGFLENWAKNGVLLINTVLTVRANCANSHKGKGWETFTDTVIGHLNKRETPVVFILWGNNAKGKLPLIDTSRHCVIASAHPSPLSAFNGFFGSKPFSRANAFLSKFGREIDWRL